MGHIAVHQQKLWLSVLIILMAICAVACQKLTIALPEQGSIIGKDISMVRTQRINAFLGIPYAQPPLQALR